MFLYASEGSNLDGVNAKYLELIGYSFSARPTEQFQIETARTWIVDFAVSLGAQDLKRELLAARIQQES
jgi:hypothetical protein